MVTTTHTDVVLTSGMTIEAQLHVGGAYNEHNNHSGGRWITARGVIEPLRSDAEHRAHYDRNIAEYPDGFIAALGSFDAYLGWATGPAGHSYVRWTTGECAGERFLIANRASWNGFPVGSVQVVVDGAA